MFSPFDAISHFLLYLVYSLEGVHALVQQEGGVIHQHVDELDKVFATPRKKRNSVKLESTYTGFSVSNLFGYQDPPLAIHYPNKRNPNQFGYRGASVTKFGYREPSLFGYSNCFNNQIKIIIPAIN